MAERVVRYREKEPLFEASGVDAEIRSTLNRRVDLPSGGYLVFDYAEAFTVIDVNTGRFVGSRSKTSGARLEDTITKNNLEAVKEVVRQLRLRDIGGIIVIDFIDMANPKNREQVEEELKQELERDRTKTYVVEISPLGLVEMTRQNVTDGPREILTKRCPTCAGDGIVVSETSLAVEAERKLRALAAQSPRTKAFKVELNAHVAAMLIGPGAERLKEIEAVTKRVFLPEGKEGVPLDHFAVLDKGTVEKLAPQSQYKDGQEIDVKLGELALHDSEARDGQGRRVRGLRRRRGPARRQEGEGPGRARPRRDDLREPRRRSGQAGDGGRADHGRGSRREADAGDRAQGRRACDRAGRARGRGGRAGAGRGRARARGRGRAEEDDAEPRPHRPRPSRSWMRPGRRLASARGAGRVAGAAGASPPAAAVGSENGAGPETDAAEVEDADADAGPRIHLPDPSLGGEEPSENGDQPARRRSRSRSRQRPRRPGRRPRKRPRTDRPPSRSRSDARAGFALRGRAEEEEDAPRLARRPTAAQDACGRLRVGARHSYTGAAGRRARICTLKRLGT